MWDPRRVGLCYCYIDECPCVLICVPKFFKTKKSCENAVIDKIFVIKYVPDCNKTQKMWGKELWVFLTHYNLFVTVIKLKKFVEAVSEYSYMLK